MKTLVAYFSASGRTAHAAKVIAETLNAELYQIQPEVIYTEEDLNWRDKTARSTVEMHDLTYRPGVADLNAPVHDAEVIYLGFPIWWYIAPTIINTFLESYDFSGKKIILFATSGGSGFGETLKHLSKSCPNAEIFEGKVFSYKSSDEDYRNFVK